MEEAIREEVLDEVEAYVMIRQNTFAQYIETRPIIDLCEEAVRRTETRVYKRWWKHEGLDLEGAWGWATEEAAVEGYRRRRKEM